MKRFWKALGMCYSMFTALPCPWKPWDEEARALMLVCLPVIGALIGGLWALLGHLGCRWLPSIRGALIAAIPWLLTGFIHLDGYMDTCDAMLSWRPLEQRVKILKDVHTGAFAVVGLGLLMLFSYDAASTLATGGDLRALVLIPIVSRCGSAFSVLTLPRIGHSEYTATQGQVGHRAAVAILWASAVAAGFLWLGPMQGIVLLIQTAAYALAMLWCFYTLKGVSGDTAGFALTVSECMALVALSHGMGGAV